MNPKEILRVGDFSIGYYKDLSERLLNNINYNPIELKSIKKAREFARNYATWQREIATAEYRPVEETGKVGQKLLDQMRWDLALEFARSGNWGAMGEEIQKDAQDFLVNPNSYEAINKGYVLQELAESLNP